MEWVGQLRNFVVQSAFYFRDQLCETAHLGRQVLRLRGLAKPLLVGLTYPYDWGFIPSTKADDGDPADALIIHDAATYPGLVLRCKPIGILEILQTQKGKKKKRNDRIFVVPDKSPFEADLTDIRSLPKRAVEELERFFEATDALDDKKLEFLRHLCERITRDG